MASKLPKTPARLSPKTEEFLDEIGRIAEEAVHQTREENRRLGLPNFQMQEGRIVAEMPDGTIRPAEEARALLLRKTAKP